MKNLYTSLFTLFIFLSFTADAQNWQWARAGLVPAGCGVATENWATTTDKWGNVYMAGSVTCTQITFGTIVLQNTGNGRMPFVVKYDSLGNVLWAKCGNTTGPNVDHGSVAVDTLGNVYLSGATQSPITFGSLTVPTTGISIYYLIKFDQNGNELWERHGGDIPYYVYSTVDHSGNILLATHFMFPFSTGSYSFVSNGSNDIIIAKYNPSGTLLWCKRYGGSISDKVGMIKCDAADNIYLSGEIGGGSTGGTLTLGLTTLSAPPNRTREYLAKLDPNGDPIWAKQSEYSGGNNIARSLTVDRQGNSYLAGVLYDSIRFAPLTLQNYPYVSSQGSFSIYVLKYDSSGNVKWLRRAGGSEGYEVPTGITQDVFGNVWLTGQMDIDPMSFDSYTVSGTMGTASTFIARIDSATGVASFLKSIPGGGNNQTGITGDPFGNIYFTGSHRYGTLTLAGTSISTINQNEAFMAKLCTTCPNSIEHTNTAKSDILVYPNPATGWLTVEGAAYEKELTLTDVLGRQLLNQKAGSDKIILNTSGLQPGVYILNIINAGNRTNTARPIVIQ